MPNRKQTFDEFSRAVKALSEATAQAKSELEIDGTIQRFEFTYELFWKTLKINLEKEGVSVSSPRDCFKQAYRLGWIENEESVLEMIDDRNRTVHLYDKGQSRKVFDKIRTLYLPLFIKIHELFAGEQ